MRLVYSRSVSGPSASALAPLFQQGNQPEGVPPLALTGERTLPDVPEENYWFRRHLAVYEWIAARVAGLRAIDMACGEGYGSDVLAHSAASVVGVDANPEAHEHARLRYTRENLRFARDLVETFPEPADAVVFLQTIEHLQDPAAVLGHFKLAGGGAGRRVRVHAQRAHPRAQGRRALGQPVARARVPLRGIREAVSRHVRRRSRCMACSTHASCSSTRLR